MSIESIREQVEREEENGNGSDSYEAQMYRKDILGLLGIIDKLSLQIGFLLSLPKGELSKKRDILLGLRSIVYPERHE